MTRTIYNETIEARAFVRHATAFHTSDEQAVIDAIWLEHKSEIEVPRCPECDWILKSFRAEQ